MQKMANPDHVIRLLHLFSKLCSDFIKKPDYYYYLFLFCRYVLYNVKQPWTKKHQDNYVKI